MLLVTKPLLDIEAMLQVGGQMYRFPPVLLEQLTAEFADQKPCLSGSHLSIHLVDAGRRLFSDHLSREQIIALCAATLNMTTEALESELNYLAGYWAMHDGGSVAENHVFPPTTD